MIIMDKIEEFFKMKLYDNEKTKVMYRSHIRNYFSVVGGFTELEDKQRELAIRSFMDTYFDDRSLKQIEMDLITFWEYLKHKAPKTKSSKIAIIRIFMRHYNKEIRNLDIWDTFRSRLRGKVKPISLEIVPGKNEIKNILNHCNVMIKTAIVMSLSSGIRIGEVILLEPEDIYLNEEPARVNIRDTVAKNGVRRTTFISTEAVELLREWYRIRSDYIENSLKSFNFPNLSHIKLEKKNDKRIFPCGSYVIRDGFNHGCDRCDYTEKTIMNGDDNKDTQRARRSLRYHNIRKYFRTYFGNSDLAEVLLGHEGYLTSIYRVWDDKRLGQEYLKYEHNVSIYSVSPDLTELQDAKIESDKLIKELQDRMERFEQLLTEKDHMLTLYKNQIENGKK